jgi:hypothetical protein
MADLWEEIMQDGSLGGIVLPIARRGFVLGRAGARVRLPYQPGQAVEDTGREPFTFKLQVELFADIDPDHYPGRYEELLELLTDEDRKGEVEYVDPMLGPFDVKVWQVDGDEVSESRNGVTLNLVLEEVSLTARGFTVEQRPSPEAEAAEAGCSVLRGARRGAADRRRDRIARRHRASSRLGDHVARGGARRAGVGRVRCSAAARRRALAGRRRSPRACGPDGRDAHHGADVALRPRPAALRGPGARG